MANKNIFDLPTLSAANFSPTEDYVIIQRPNGGTYKIIASEILSVSKNMNSLRVGYKTQIHQRDASMTDTSETVIFYQENLLAFDSAFEIDIDCEVVTNGSQGIYSVAPAEGDTRSLTFNKPYNSNLISKRYSIGAKSTSIESFTFDFTRLKDIQHYPKTGRMDYTEESGTIKFFVNFDLEETDTIKLSFSRESSINASRNYLPASSVEFSITLTAHT